MKYRNLSLVLSSTLVFAAAPVLQAAENALVLEPKDGPGAGKHIVLLAGDEEYRSEEALPMLAKILSQHHGFKCTVLFSASEDGTITPNDTTSISGMEALDKADLFITSLRFRNWPEEAIGKFEKAVLSGKPIVSLRTSTHAFAKNRLDGFGKKFLGEGWVSHWGKHKVEGTRGVTEPSAEGSALLHGVSGVFGTTDVYEAHPPADATILLRGQVLESLLPDSKPAAYVKKRKTDQGEQDVNSPMMPIAWTRTVANEAGTVNKILCTTMGSADDLQSEGLRRLIVNGVYWGLQMDVPYEASVAYVDEYNPGFYGNNGYRKGMKISDLELGKVMPGEPNPAPTPKQ